MFLAFVSETKRFVRLFDSLYLAIFSFIDYADAAVFIGIPEFLNSGRKSWTQGSGLSKMNGCG